MEQRGQCDFISVKEVKNCKGGRYERTEDGDMEDARAYLGMLCFHTLFCFSTMLHKERVVVGKLLILLGFFFCLGTRLE